MNTLRDDFFGEEENIRYDRTLDLLFISFFILCLAGFVGCVIWIFS